MSESTLGACSALSRLTEPPLTRAPTRRTTFSGIAYGSARVFDGQIRQILNWPGSYETYRKVPTCILYEQHDPSEEAKIVSWGLEAKNTTVREGFVKCEWFKLLLSPESLRSGVPDPWLPPLPAGKNVVDVIADFLRCIWRYARRVITEEIGSVVDLSESSIPFPYASSAICRSRGA